jgi:hydroxypyruvate isomerase
VSTFKWTARQYNARMLRREFLTTVAAAGVVAVTSSSSSALGQSQPAAPIKRKGRLKQSLFRTVFGQNTPGLTTFDEQCREAARLGAYGFDLIGPQDWPTMKKYGLVPTLGPMSFASLTDGLVHKEQWPMVEKALRDEVEVCAAGGCKGIITFAGQRKGMTFEQGMDLTVEFMNRVKAMLEDKGVTLCMENANSRYPDNVLGRPDQLADRPSWGFEMCKRVNSPNVKMVYDIYHAQIMEGNVAAAIKDNIKWIFHFHCAGVPGRHEIDDTQELNYRFIAQTIVDAGYTGYIAHEYRPTPGRDPLKSIEADMAILDV